MNEGRFHLRWSGAYRLSGVRLLYFEGSGARSSTAPRGEGMIYIIVFIAGVLVGMVVFS